MKILVAVDGSDCTQRMLAYWMAHGEWLSPSHAYTVLTVVQTVPARAAAVLDRAALQAYYADEGEQTLQPVRRCLDRHDVQATFLSKTGASVGDVIAKTADSEGFDLVLLGSHGHGAIGNLLLGSVATRVLVACRTPVLIVR
jgi:nucleotide-binding universal stress UspA family protein